MPTIFSPALVVRASGITPFYYEHKPVGKIAGVYDINALGVNDFRPAQGFIVHVGG